jgi:hypothetical protein
VSDGGIRVVVPPGLESGVYANLLNPWHTVHELTLDFAVLHRPLSEADEQSAQLVARVRIPATIAFDMIRSINDELSAYELEAGELRRPGDAPDAP